MNENNATALDISTIQGAFSSFERALRVYAKIENRTSPLPETDELEVLRAGVIQNFEFTYELCWKFMKRWLETNLSPGIADGVPRIELFRLAAENKLIADVPKWMEFHLARNRTSHIYGEATAADVFACARDFFPLGHDFLAKLEARV
jgi:nucleotidyltransferase substrate binding protein (TIGR01987 family)